MLQQTILLKQTKLSLGHLILWIKEIHYKSQFYSSQVKQTKAGSAAGGRSRHPGAPLYGKPGGGGVRVLLDDLGSADCVIRRGPKSSPLDPGVVG